jgi:hypothetical protein
MMSKVYSSLKMLSLWVIFERFMFCCYCFLIVGPTGVLIQQHHYQAIPAQSELPAGECENNNPKLDRMISSGSNQLSKSFCVTSALHDCKLTQFSHLSINQSCFRL